eukprot:jgi/Astpho2/6824/Aster-06500
MKRETGDRTHRASRHPGPAKMPPCERAAPPLQHTSAVRSASVPRLISAVRMISDARLSELWSIYQCPYSARCACNVEIVQPPLTPVGTGRRPDSLLLHEKACVVLLASLLDHRRLQYRTRCKLPGLWAPRHLQRNHSVQ